MIGADEIIVLDKGVIVERGTHAALLARGGVYAAMWNRQREAEEAREALKRAEEDEEGPRRRPGGAREPCELTRLAGSLSCAAAPPPCNRRY